MRKRLWWLRVTMSVFTVVLFIGGAILTAGVVVAKETATQVPPQSSGSHTNSANLTEAGSCFTECIVPITGSAIQWLFGQIPHPSPSLTCEVVAGAAPISGPLEWTLIGPACESPSGGGGYNLAGLEQAVGDNLITGLSNSLNITSSEVENVNASVAELLSYYETRAEAIVPYFLNYTWSPEVYDTIAMYSGLVPAIEGYDVAFGAQQYQDWNAFAKSWDAAFGTGGTLSGDSTAINFASPFSDNLLPGVLSRNGDDFNVSSPWEWWGAPGPSGLYFNLMPGGTIMEANYNDESVGNGFNFPDEIVHDLTTGTSFTVPQVNYSDWISQKNLVNVSKTYNIGPFDLLYMTCVAVCTSYTDQSLLLVSGGYAFENVTPLNPDVYYIDTMVPHVMLMPPSPSIDGSPGLFYAPQSGDGVCWGENPAMGAGILSSCGTWVAPTEGNSSALGTGPGSVPASDNALTEYAATFQNLVNDTMNMAHAYYTVLEAVTNDSEYSIPATCTIPTPSNAFPADTNFADYSMNEYNILAVYLAYLNSVAEEYNQVFTTGTDFCGNPDLGFSFNWTESWNLALNITGSIYLANANGPAYPNGTGDSTSSYYSDSTWPIRGVQSLLLFPYEYQLNVPVGQTFPVPVNDPIAAVTTDWTGNLDYGTLFTPAWGVPTYLTLNGEGNYVYISGVQSNYGSDRSNATGAAIEISSCYLNGVPKNPCDLAVTYFNNFTIGLVHATVAPPPPSSSGGLSSLGNSCGFTVLNQWYDGWAGFIGTAIGEGIGHLAQGASGIPIIGGGLADLVNGLACVIAWVVVILIFILFIYIAASVLVGMVRSLGRRERQGKNPT